MTTLLWWAAWIATLLIFGLGWYFFRHRRRDTRTFFERFPYE